MENTNLKIEKYLNNELSEADLAAFRKELVSDKALAIEVKEELMIREALEANEKERFKQQLQQKKRNKVVQLKKTNNFRWLAIAASFALFLIPAFQVFQHTNSNIANQHFEKDPSITSQLLSPDANKTAIEVAVEAYRIGDYHTAIEKLSSLKNNTQATYVLGHTYFLSENYPNAIAQFNKVIDSKNPEYLEKAEWYMLISLLKADELNAEFYTLLDKIIQQESIYSESASSIQADLNSSWRIRE